MFQSFKTRIETVRAISFNKSRRDWRKTSTKTRIETERMPGAVAKKGTLIKK